MTIKQYIGQIRWHEPVEQPRGFFRRLFGLKPKVIQEPRWKTNFNSYDDFFQLLNCKLQFMWKGQNLGPFLFNDGKKTYFFYVSKGRKTLIITSSVMSPLSSQMEETKKVLQNMVCSSNLAWTENSNFLYSLTKDKKFYIKFNIFDSWTQRETMRKINYERKRELDAKRKKEKETAK